MSIQDYRNVAEAVIGGCAVWLVVLAIALVVIKIKK